MSGAPQSHGRGGAGNIAPDTTQYADGEISRVGEPGQSADGGAFSTGRGGAGNIGSPGLKAQHERADEVIPDASVRKSTEEPYHVGRGGGGNAVPAQGTSQKTGTGSGPGLVDKLKAKILHKDDKPST
ncbi:MAG: hypothetical protein M1814_000649 [Vezdaea aestivalis]|nr:MAG: hypothetical protein M1814_000649 [Vezdaea aestivalis]